MNRLFRALAGLCSLLSGCTHQFIGVDTGEAPSAYTVTRERLQIPPTGWVRVRGVVAVSAEKTEEWNRSLVQIRASGTKVCCFVNLDPLRWHSGVRGSGGNRLPRDLSEAYVWAQRLAERFSANVDCWEIGNEPDLFVGDNASDYAAFVKAVALGLRAGAFRPGSPARSPLIVMGGFGLPPGRFVALLKANGIIDYVDGLNFHYYGYDEDWRGVYDSYRAMFETGGEGSGPTRHFAVMLSEFGYGMLSQDMARTEKGRQNQRRWFEGVVSQMKAVPLTAAMAFYLDPYFERGLNEFGLLVSDPASNSAEVSARTQLSPAGDYILKSGSLISSHQKGYWRLPAANPSAVVLDFLPGNGLRQARGDNGYRFETGDQPGQESHLAGSAKIYNFSDEPVTGRLWVTGAFALGDHTNARELSIPAMGTVSVDLVVSQHALPFSFEEGALVFSEKNGNTRKAVFVTRFLPIAPKMSPQVYTVINGSSGGVKANVRTRRDISIAREEPKMNWNGSLFATPGVTVRRQGGGWIVEVMSVPAESLRPASVEIPLPDSFAIEPDSWCRFRYRCASVGSQLGRYSGLSRAEGGSLEVGIRSVTGDLFEVWPRLEVGRARAQYYEPLANFGLSFYGRSQPPWSLSEAKPLTMVFFFRPSRLPATYEISDPEFIRF